MLRSLTALSAATAAALALAAPAPAAVPVESPSIPQSAPVLLKSPGELTPSRTGRSRVLVIGDSLTAGIAKTLPSHFPGWRVGINGLGGRPMNEGMGYLASYDLGRTDNLVLIMGLFTNDRANRVWALKTAVRESLRRVGPDGCVVWATVYRPDVGYGTYAKANAALRQLAREHRTNMRLVDWSKSLRKSPTKMDWTQVHPDSAAGWTRRASMYAQAARSC